VSGIYWEEHGKRLGTTAPVKIFDGQSNLEFETQQILNLSDEMWWWTRSHAGRKRTSKSAATFH